MLKTKELYDLTHTKAAVILENTEYPWEALGKIKDFDYVLELETPAVRNLIWRVEFERDTDDGRDVEQDMLFRLVTGKVDDETCVMSCGFL